MNKYIKESPYIYLLIILGSGIICGFLFYLLIKKWLHKIFDIDNDIINKNLQPPFFLFVTIVVLKFGIPVLYGNVGPMVYTYIQKTTFIALVLSIVWLLMRVVVLIGLIVEKRFDIHEEEDNLKDRKIQTQFRYIQRVINLILWILAISAVLLSFKEVRHIGTSLLASAGLAGIIIGFAAQKTLANLVAGFQIAFSQPIRIGDVVIVEKEYGLIEEITLTYVVVKIWDERRMILPLSYFIEKPFQNWTRTKAELIGAVLLFVDYSVKIDHLREELDKYLSSNELWDEKVANVAIVETTEDNMQVRILVSAKDSGTTWDLRCQVREHLIGFIQQNYPEGLPYKSVQVKN